MVDNPLWEICERAAEVQALLHDHVDCGKHSAADVVGESVDRSVRARVAAGYVRSRLLPAEHAAG